MYNSSGNKGFEEQAEQWKHENTNPGDGRLFKAKGARIDNHSDGLKDVQEKRRQSECGGSMYSGSGSKGFEEQAEQWKRENTNPGQSVRDVYEDSTSTSHVQALKEKGNGCVREKKYEEAILHYTHAIKIDPRNFSLYSNRSYAFLKIRQYYHAFEDALETVRLKPDWPKGHFRKGEVESATYQFSDALLSYRLALTLQPNDPTIEEAIKQTSLRMTKDKKGEEQYPWLGAGIGIIFGVVIVMADQVTIKPSLNHPILMALLTIVVAVLGFGMAKGYRYYLNCQRKGLLDPPLDLLQEMQNENGKDGEREEKSTTNSYHRYTKAQARQKLRKGKT